MPVTTYQTKVQTVASERGADALVVHCSDPRYQPHFQEFLRDGLGLTRYALVAVPGGAHCLTLTEYLPKFSWVGWRWMKFLADCTGPARVVLIGHDDCQWYLDGRFSHLHAGRPKEAQETHLQQVASELASRVPSVSVERWFARLDGSHARFDRLG
jgi:hypothetical protein